MEKRAKLIYSVHILIKIKKEKGNLTFNRILNIWKMIKNGILFILHIQENQEKHLGVYNFKTKEKKLLNILISTII